MKPLIRNFILALSLLLTFGLSTAQSTLFVFVQIPESIEPFEREEKYGDPINLVLIEEKLGEVSGGGSMLSAPKSDGTQEIEWVGIDVDLTNPKKGIEVLKQELITLGAPLSTVLEIHRATGIEAINLGAEGWQ